MKRENCELKFDDKKNLKWRRDFSVDFLRSNLQNSSNFPIMSLYCKS